MFHQELDNRYQKQPTLVSFLLKLLECMGISYWDAQEVSLPIVPMNGLRMG